MYGSCHCDFGDDSEERIARLEAVCRRMEARLVELESANAALRLQRLEFDYKPLYVSMLIDNEQAIVDWARNAGLVVESDRLNAAIVASAVPVNPKFLDSVRFPDEIRVVGGERLVGRIKDAIVLFFESQQLVELHHQFAQMGAVWPFLEYEPHIVLMFGGSGVDISNIEPYRGPIVGTQYYCGEMKVPRQ